MFTRFDKAIAALLGTVASLGAMLGFQVKLDPELVTLIAGIVSGLLVYFTPNKSK